ncbi:MAG: hypothetical protein HYY17_02565 [Planctomycetes bacterium]|nr:hypothetical protein [Planctomycetota bacterium]
MGFDFDLFGEGKKDVSWQGQIKEWVRAHFKVPEAIPVLVTEIRCDQPGCAPVETIIAILDPAGRQQWKSPRPMREVRKEDIPHLRPNPEGHGPRIDIDRLGEGKWA